MTGPARALPHNCPGCDKPGIPYHKLACGPCWRRLPGPMRVAVLKGGSSRLHAVSNALTWYRHNRQDTP